MRARGRHDVRRARRPRPRARPRARHRDAHGRRTRTARAGSARASSTPSTSTAVDTDATSRPTRGTKRHRAHAVLVVVRRREHRRRLVVGRRLGGQVRGAAAAASSSGSQGSAAPASARSPADHTPVPLLTSQPSRVLDGRVEPAICEGAPMSDKPSYLGLLNAIAVAEAQAHEYLTVVGRRHAEPRRAQGAAHGRGPRGRARHELRQAHQRARLRSSLQRRLRPRRRRWRW